MDKAELKTGATDGDVGKFLATLTDEQRAADARRLCELLTAASGKPPVMWGKSIIGFGEQRLVYDSGRELDWFEIGFSPRKQQTTLYLTDGTEPYADVLARLGKHSTGKGCVNLKRLSDVDDAVLTELVTRSIGNARAR